MGALNQLFKVESVLKAAVSNKQTTFLFSASTNRYPQVSTAAPPTPPTRPCHHHRRNSLLSGPRTDFSLRFQSDAPTGLSSHGQQSDPPRLPEPRLQLQQRSPGAGHHADGLQGQMEQKDGFSLVCHRLCGGPGQCLEISVHMLSKRRR